MRWFGWFRKPEVLKPGICECSHIRCAHIGGKGRCVVSLGVARCACMIFIRDEEEDDGGGEPLKPVPVDPELAELRRIAKL